MIYAKEHDAVPVKTMGWGRRQTANAWTGVKAAALMLICPILSILLTIDMEYHNGDLRQLFNTATLHQYWQNLSSQELLVKHQIIASFLLFQAVLYKVLPGPYHTGQHTPGGQLLQYKTNGLAAFVATYCVFWLGHVLGFYHAAFIATDFSTMVVALNMWGLILTVAAYIKACVLPTSLADRFFTGSFMYDMCMGVELNPRLPVIDDLKLFIVGRAGMTIWALVLTSFAMLQHQTTGKVSGAMLIGTSLQFEYIIDFFWNEHWYLRTIDVAHDHVGFYMVWGCIAWLPSTYTLHAQFMARSGVGVSDATAMLLFACGTAGYLLFRLVNNQKYRVRATGGKCTVWGQPATFITAQYLTADGASRESILLTCGWWGLARHINYVGDLIFSFATCAATGLNGILPWFYAIFLWVLLLHRCFRDEARCETKYGKDWQKYREQVRWRLVPYVL